MAQADKGLAHVAPLPREEASPALAVDPPADEIFDPFFNETFPELVKTGLFYGHNLHDAQDAAEEIMVEVRQKWHMIKNHTAYARTAVIRLVAKTQKRRREGMAGAAARGAFLPESLDDCDLNAAEDEQYVLELLAVLPKAQRDVMASYFDGLSYCEIAAGLGKTEAAVRKNMQLARARLKIELENQREHERHSWTTLAQTTRRETR